MKPIRGLASRATLRLAAPFIAFVSVSCISAPPEADLSAIYNEAAQSIGDDRNPVIVIPGILGSKLYDPRTQTDVWGAFVYGAADADLPEGARLIALPIERDVPLAQLTDSVVPTEVLDTLTLDIAFIRGIRIGAYVDILITLAAGEYRDETLGEFGVIDYGGRHYTCFQLGYDWRRDISEQSVRVHEMILAAKRANPRYAEEGDALKVDVVAHSMGGLVLRYYLRYGPNPIGPDGTIPPLTWEGARHVERAILVGTPSGGSVTALQQLVEGVRFALLTPRYRPSVLGTMPAIYQLLPRPSHGRVVNAETGEPIDLYDPAVWEAFGWGLGSDDPDRALAWLLPNTEDETERIDIARNQLARTLARTRLLHEALDTPADLPPGLEIILFAGDAEDTADIIEVNPRSGRLRVVSTSPGDGTVTRASALMDQRLATGYTPYLDSPVDWSMVYFVHADHIGLTRHATFTDNLLWLLLEKPRDRLRSDGGFSTPGVATISGGSPEAQAGTTR